MRAFTHEFRQGYGSPEVDESFPTVVGATLDDDRRGVHLVVDGLVEGHVHDFDFAGVRNAAGASLVHTTAHYTLNRMPR